MLQITSRNLESKSTALVPILRDLECLDEECNAGQKCVGTKLSKSIWMRKKGAQGSIITCAATFAAKTNRAKGTALR